MYLHRIRGKIVDAKQINDEVRKQNQKKDPQSQGVASKKEPVTRCRIKERATVTRCSNRGLDMKKEPWPLDVAMDHFILKNYDCI